MRIGFAVALWMWCAVAASADGDWARLREGGHVLLMRHAQTDAGIGDPPGFKLDDCSTQRNLSEEGRAQARRTGEAFRRNGIILSEVRSSTWCRCVETAKLAFGGATVWPALDSLFAAPERKEVRNAQVRQAINRVAPPRNLMLVTHQNNITALTGEPVASGEIVVIRPPVREGEPLRIVARLRVP